MALKILSIICCSQIVWCFTGGIQMRINNINGSSDKNTIPKDNQQLYHFGKCMINCLIDNRNEECNKVKKCVGYCITPKPSSDTQDIPSQDHVTTEQLWQPDQKEMVTTETDYWNPEWDPSHDLYHSLHHADGAVGEGGLVYEKTTWPKGSRFTYENNDRSSFGIINFDNFFKFFNCQADCLRKYFINQTPNANSFLSFMGCSVEKCICIKNS